jgi:hypothetical protein
MLQQNREVRGQLNLKLDRMAIVSIRSNSAVAPEPVHEPTVRQTLGLLCWASGIWGNGCFVSEGIIKYHLGDFKCVYQIRSVWYPIPLKAKPSDELKQLGASLVCWYACGCFDSFWVGSSSDRVFTKAVRIITERIS